MRVGTLMSPNPATCTPMDSAERAARLMRDHDCGAIPVVDEDDRVVGIVTDRDICMAALDHERLLTQIPVAHCMQEDVIVIDADASVGEAASLMQRHRIRRLPVVSDEGKVVGLLSIDDLAVASAHPTPVVQVAESLVAQTLAAACEPAVTAPGP